MKFLSSHRIPVRIQQAMKEQTENQKSLNLTAYPAQTRK